MIVELSIVASPFLHLAEGRGTGGCWLVGRPLLYGCSVA